MSAKFFGQFLLEKGRISSQQLVDALEYQKSVTQPIAVLALESGMLTADQVYHVLKQLRPDKHFRHPNQRYFRGLTPARLLNLLT